MSNSNVLKEISTWSIEAKEEDTSRYFFHFDDVSELENGQKNYVIGRKGTGKTAIAEYLHNTESHNKFSRLLSFKNFPFNSLYEYADEHYSRPNQYITIWTYVIYHYICSMLADNENVCRNTKIDLKTAFDFEVTGALARSVSTITSSSYSLSILGIGGKIGRGREKGTFDYVQANETLKKFILEQIDESKYFIIFDELDEDYRDIFDPDRRHGYFELLISLFKAVQNIRSEFSDSKANLRPVIFLRDDIFDLCRDVDKNKWLDRAVKLDWDIRQLRELVLFRFEQAIRLHNDDVDVEKIWDSVFSVKTTNVNNRKNDTFKYLTSRTFLRPRDIISYIRECARVTVSQNKNRISNTSIKEAANAHSAYLRREVIDELFPVIDDIAEILDVLSRIRKPIFTRKEFNDRYREFLNQNPTHNQKLSESQILKLLYHFNILGNITKGNHRIFAYDSAVKIINMDENLCVHHGLLNSLHIH